MNLCIAVLLVLHSLPGKAEVEEDMEMEEGLYDYLAHLSDYPNTTEDYYFDNTTATPTMYLEEFYSYELDSYETSTFGEVDWDEWFPEENTTPKIPGDAEDSQDSQESFGLSLQCHLTLVTLLSFLGLLL